MLKLLGGRVYVQKVEPSLLIVHPDNRSGLMVNSHDVHEKGLLALKLGFEEKKLNESYCFEMNACKATRDKAIASMQKLHENSDKRLAPLNGTERFMSVSSSHISQFCKAVACGQCVTEVPELVNVNQGCLTLDSCVAHFQDEEFGRLAKHGWMWHCIKSEVEDACPWFPQLLQASLNTVNMIGKEPKEMELAMALAFNYKILGSMEKASQECKTSTSLKYMDVITVF